MVPGARSAGWAVSVTLALAVLPPPVAAQRAPGPESSVTVGPSFYHFTRSGTGFAGKAALSFRPGHRVLVIELGLGYVTYHNDFGARIHWLFPELSAQAEGHLGAVRPYLGVGAGGGVLSQVGQDRFEGTLHGAGGVRLRLGRGWGARVEVLVRAVHASGHSVDVGAGFVRGIF